MYESGLLRLIKCDRNGWDLDLVDHPESPRIAPNGHKFIFESAFIKENASLLNQTINYIEYHIPWRLYSFLANLSTTGTSIIISCADLLQLFQFIVEGVVYCSKEKLKNPSGMHPSIPGHVLATCQCVAEQLNQVLSHEAERIQTRCVAMSSESYPTLARRRPLMRCSAMVPEPHALHRLCPPKLVVK